MIINCSSKRWNITNCKRLYIKSITLAKVQSPLRG